MKASDKQQVIERWKEVFANSSVLVLASYTGLTANALNTLPKQAREAGVDFHVVKNNLVRIALKGSINEFLGDSLKGPVAIATCAHDQIAPAKLLVKAAKDNKALEILGGAIDGQRLDANGVVTLSKMPSKDELRAQFLGLLNAVPGGFVRLLAAVPGGFLNVLDARRRALEEEGKAA